MTVANSARRLALVATLALAGVMGAQEARAQSGNCVDTLAGISETSRFVSLVTRTHVAEDIRALGPFTIFAPTNAAIDRVRPILEPILFPSGDGGSAMDPILAPAAANAHILEGRYTTAAVEPGQTVTTRSRAGNRLTVTNTDGKLTLTANGITATVIRANIPCANGIIHIVDQSLVR